MNNSPTVSIFCMVYNHEPFLKECLDGFLMQKCNFDFQIIIGEDCSTDKSREIILDYAYRNPRKFKLLLHDKNIGASENQRLVFENCTGKYIAMCEGDDYWTDPLKLQKQVDFLEKNEDFSMCFHCANIKIEIEDYEFKLGFIENRQYSINEVIKGRLFQTSTVMFRNILNMNTLKNKLIANGDQILFLECSEKGKVMGMVDVMSVYRIHSNGVSISRIRTNEILAKKKNYKQLIYIQSQFKSISKDIMNDLFVDNSMTLFVLYFKKRSILCFYYLFRAIYFKPKLIFKAFNYFIKKK